MSHISWAMVLGSCKEESIFHANFNEYRKKKKKRSKKAQCARAEKQNQNSRNCNISKWISFISPYIRVYVFITQPTFITVLNEPGFSFSYSSSFLSSSHVPCTKYLLIAQVGIYHAGWNVLLNKHVGNAVMLHLHYSPSILHIHFKIITNLKTAACVQCI